MAFFQNFKKSFYELKSIRCLTTTAILIALTVVLKFLMIVPSATLKISISFVGLASIGMLFGPTVAGFAGIITDILGFIVKPTGTFSPLFTLVEMTAGIIYGCFLYGFNPTKPDFSGKSATISWIKTNILQLMRIIVCKFCINLFCNVCMNTCFMVVMKYIAPDVFWVKIGERILKNAMLLPIETLILIIVLYPVAVAYKAINRRIA